MYFCSKLITNRARNAGLDAFTKKMVKTTFTTELCYNPFLFNGVSVHNFNFFKDGQVIASFKWLGSNNVYKTMELPFTVKKAVKINLNRSDAFYISKRDDFNYRTFEFYIPADFVNLQFVEKKQSASWHTIIHQAMYSVTVTGEKYIPKLDENKNLYYETKYGTFTEKFDCNNVAEDTEEYKRCKELAEKMTKATAIKIDPYTVHDLLQKFDIVEKENNNNNQ